MTRTLSVIAAVSGLYDAALGVLLLVWSAPLAAWFGGPPPTPAIQAQLNGLFLLAVGGGYVYPYRDPVRYRFYLWVMGPWLKGAGALLFVADYLLRSSPASFLLFAATDGLLAGVTLWALWRGADS